MRTKVCLLLIFGFLYFGFSKAEASIWWTMDNFDYNATDAGGYYFSWSTGQVPLDASSEKSQQNGDSENAAVATAAEPQQGWSTQKVILSGLSMASGAWGNSFQDLTQDSGGATVYAYADNTYALDGGAGVFQNGQNVSSYIDRYFTVGSNQTYTLSASAVAPRNWRGAASGSATALQPILTGCVRLIQTDTNGDTTTVQSFGLSTLLSSSQQVSVSLFKDDLYQLVVAIGNVLDFGGEQKPAGIVTSFNNLDAYYGWSSGNIDGDFNIGTAKNPVTITASLSPPAFPVGGPLPSSGWMHLSWFGYYYADPANSASWIYHQTLGWLYTYGTSQDSIWFWDPEMDGWWWTSDTVYPYIYRASDGNWLYYDEGSYDPRWFYNCGTRKWEND